MLQIIWTRNFLLAQGYDIKNNIVYQDNKSAILLETNGIGSSSKRTHHINIHCFFRWPDQSRQTTSWILRHRLHDCGLLHKAATRKKVLGDEKNHHERAVKIFEWGKNVGVKLTTARPTYKIKLQECVGPSNIVLQYSTDSMTVLRLSYLELVYSLVPNSIHMTHRIVCE